MWNGGNHPLYSSMNNNNDPPPPRPEGTASRSSSIHMDTDQLDAVSALTSLQGGAAFPTYFVDPMVAAAAGFYAPPMAFYPTSQHHRDEPPRSILEMSHIYSSSPGGPTVASSAPDEEEDSEEEEDDEAPPVSSTPIPVAPRGKPESAAARARWLHQPDAAEEVKTNASPQKKTARSSKTASSPKKKKKPSSAAASSSQPTAAASASNALVDLALTPAREFLLGETVPRITDAEYHNLSQLLLQFCKVPLLAEFRRPVSLLHPEVMPLYSKIVTYPVDLGYVCRGVRRRHYQHTRDVRLDVWRVFANCVKYNSHPSNKEAVPSFVSIALHLRDYFNNLWQEYMVPSDPPSSAEATEHLVAYEIHQAAFEKRNEERRKRLENSGVLVLSKTFTTKAAKLLSEFIENGGCVDSLDTTPLFGAADPDPEVDLVVERLGQYQTQLQDMSSAATAVEYTLDTFHKDLTNCYTEHVLEDNPSLRNRFRCRLDRFFWKQAVPLHEANSRGVTQSSIWGNLAATIWARESSKKPYWPALCLGILPPAEQREGWHQAVTERNESRLPEKLRTQLMIAKKRCEQAQKRQSLSYFLVEFLGTHEFIWVRETDIIENFDPNADPNKIHGNVKKSRSTSSVVGSKIYATALQECVWASEEYENVLQDAFENAAAPDTEEDDELNFSFHTLAQSDDEAEVAAGSRGYQYESDVMDMSDVEEANYLIAHDGILDTSIAGRKNTKKRSQAVKKQVPSKSAPSKEDTGGKKKRSRPAGKKADDGGEDDDDDANVPEAVVVQDERGDQRELERRRKKRMRDHEKSERTEARKKTKRRRSISNEEGDGKLVMQDKQTRAAVIVKAYINRLAKQGDYKSLALSGVLTMPSSSVDSVGLLGLSLAFRAASGFLHMPDATKEELAKLKPWVVIDTETQNTSAERVQQIKKKIELLNREIESVRNDTKRRKDLVSEYVARREEKELIVEAEDMAARLNHYKKRKRATPTKNDERSDNESPEGKMSIDGTQETVEDEVEDMSKEHSDVETDMDEPMLVATEDSPGVEEQSDEGDSDE